ncbi:MAG TPA: GlsB/YeaQ/YmgE family stress response membrane protein [Phototrophicaceae bacterium]|nr:GlsB/YeaQ/YmgE family stress response membrane protein [Phototrophicaceae bacterium]
MDIGALIGDIIAAPFICIGWIIIGAVAGALARQIMGSTDKPLISDLILGLIGAMVGGFVASLLGLYKPAGGLGLLLVNLVIAIVGAVILIAVGRAVMGRKVA